MKPILVFRHVRHEGPGYLADFFHRHDIPYRLVCIDRDDPVPDSLDGVSGLVFMGGPMSVNDPLDWVSREIDLIRLAYSREMPVLGHCLGGQLIARALGAQVSSNGRDEIGWFPVAPIANEIALDWTGHNTPVEVYHWHGETFSIPAGGVPILESDACRNQAFVAGNSLAMQCHIEMTADMVCEWARINANVLSSPSATVQPEKEMLRELDNRISRLNRFAEHVYGRWIQGIS